MARRTSALELAVPPRSTGGPAYRWLYGALRSAILKGRLSRGARLPATRDLARQYVLARGTVVNAYEQLKSEGYIEGSAGSGTYVSRVLPEQWLQVDAPVGKQPTARRLRTLPVSDYSRRVQLFTTYENRPVRAFRANLPALDLFPVELWTRLSNRCLRRAPISQWMGCDALGYTPLRQAIADYLTTSRGVKCAAEHVAIVSGVQEALDIACRLFVNPGDAVGMERPGYPGAQLAFRAWGARVRKVAVDTDGANVARLPRGMKLIYITPGHQFPLGTTMSLARRMEVLDWARRTGAVVFEDDYDGEFRYSGRPIPAMQGLDESGTVLYAGSFSKVLFPGLRLGYLVSPNGLVDLVAAIKSITSRHCPVFEQVVLSQFMVEGHFARHVRRMREVYAERLSVLLEEGRSVLAGLLELSAVEAGLQTVGWLGNGLESEAAEAAARKRGVDVTSLRGYGDKKLRGLHLGFAAVRPAEIRRGVRELAIALESQKRGVR
jgi:GntR family transcriptional regulator / MocR family aminotransferase